MGWFTAQWKMLLFCAKTIAKESCKLILSQCFLAPLGVLFVMKTLEDEE